MLLFFLTPVLKNPLSDSNHRFRQSFSFGFPFGNAVLPFQILRTLSINFNHDSKKGIQPFGPSSLDILMPCLSLNSKKSLLRLGLWTFDMFCLHINQKQLSVIVKILHKLITQLIRHFNKFLQIVISAYQTQIIINLINIQKTVKLLRHKEHKPNIYRKFMIKFVINQFAKYENHNSIQFVNTVLVNIVLTAANIRTHVVKDNFGQMQDNSLVCSYCSEKIYNLINHLKQCQMISVNCEFCLQDYIRKFYLVHLELCLSKKIVSLEFESEIQSQVIDIQKVYIRQSTRNYLNNQFNEIKYDHIAREDETLSIN
ncbi:hypothetical protein pb186bvf_000147 [Paramecium bursaria]